MNQQDQEQQQTEQVVEQLVQRRVARKALRDIYHQVDEIEQQVFSEKRNAKYLLPLGILLFVLVVIFLVKLPQISRLFSNLFNAL